MSESDSEAMIRWQGYARENRTAANSHFLAYSAAILALQTSILTDAEIKIIKWPCLFIAAGSLAIIALLLGSLIVLVRLRDARLTARVARYRHTGRPQKDIDDMRSRADFYSGLTNKVLPWQVISFSISALVFVIWVVGAHMAKLFGAAG